jgi:hypothetical protein
VSQEENEWNGNAMSGGRPPPAPFMMTVPSPMGMMSMVVTEKAVMATGLPRVPRTIHRHAGLFSQIHDMPPACQKRVVALESFAHEATSVPSQKKEIHSAF